MSVGKTTEALHATEKANVVESRSPSIGQTMQQYPHANERWADRTQLVCRCHGGLQDLERIRAGRTTPLHETISASRASSYDCGLEGCEHPSRSPFLPTSGSTCPFGSTHLLQVYFFDGKNRQVAHPGGGQLVEAPRPFSAERGQAQQLLSSVAATVSTDAGGLACKRGS